MCTYLNPTIFLRGGFHQPDEIRRRRRDASLVATTFNFIFYIKNPSFLLFFNFRVVMVDKGCI